MVKFMKNLFIHNTKPIQENFYGNGAIYHGYAGMPDSAGRTYTEEQCEIEAARATAMRLKVARTMYKWWAWDEHTNTWNWDNEVMTAFYKWLGAMKKGGISVSLNAGWCSPGDIASNFWMGRSPFTVEGDWQASVQNYADWVSETLHQLVEIRGFDNIKFLTLFTEPQNLNGAAMVEGMHPYRCWYDAAKAVHETLIRDGRRDMVKIMGPNEGSTITSDMVNWLSQQDCDFVDVFSSHNYFNTRQIPYGTADESKSFITMETCGGRFFRKVELKSDENYTVNVKYKLIKATDNPRGNAIFGVFNDCGKYDIFCDESCDTYPPVTPNTKIVFPISDMTNGAVDYTFTFKVPKEQTANVGVLCDIKTAGDLFAVTEFKIIDSKGNPIYDNWDFCDEGKGWRVFACADYPNAYSAWCRWCNTGLGYVPSGKMFCFDEYNTSSRFVKSEFNHGAEIVNAAIAFMNCGAGISLLWTLFDQQWPNSHSTNSDLFFDGDHRFGVMPTLRRTLIPHLSYYAFGLLSRYTGGENCKVYKGSYDGRIATTMCVMPNGDITVVVVNNKEIADEFKINFEKPMNGIKFNRHTFDPVKCIPDEKAEMIGIDRVTEPVTDSLSDVICAYGVTVYTTMKD